MLWVLVVVLIAAWCLARASANRERAWTRIPRAGFLVSARSVRRVR